MGNLIIYLCAAVISTAVVWPKAFARTVSNAKEFFMNEMREELSKRDVYKTLIADEQTKVYRCYEVKLSDKLTIVRRK